MTKFERIKDKMDSNGYSHFNLDNYKAKNNKPCFIPENGDSIDDVFSWQDLFKESLETIKSKDFLLSVAENYDKSNLINYIETIDTIDYYFAYLVITDETPEEFAETFMDNYFLGGDEIWCRLSTKLQDYMQ